MVRHNDGAATLYAHLDNRLVQEGDTVSAEAIVGTSDTTGLASGPHLHFEYVPSGPIIGSKARIDPEPCIREGRDYYVWVHSPYFSSGGSICTSADGEFLGCLETAWQEGITEKPLVRYQIEDYEVGKHTLEFTWSGVCQYISYWFFPVESKDARTVSLSPTRYLGHRFGQACTAPNDPRDGSPRQVPFYVVPDAEYWKHPDPSIFE